MQQSTILPVRRLAPLALRSSKAPCRSFASTSQQLSRLYQCQSPLLSHRLKQPSQRYSRGKWQARRNYETRTVPLRDRLRQLQKTNPVAFPTALVCIAAATACAIYVTYYYMTAIYPIDSTYPPAVATKLKRAIYYSASDPQPAKALDYYQQALQLCEEAEMNPFSAEVIGIKLKIVSMLTKNNHFREAVEVLEILKKDCQRFVEYCDAPDKQQLAKARTRVLIKVIQMSVKLGELYSNVYVNNSEAAERHLVEGVELVLKETNRRQQENVTEEQAGPWVEPEEMGGGFEMLANLYEQQDKHYLAAPLYLRAITLAQPPSCHTAVLMNNLAIALAQTSPERPPATSSSRADPPTSRPALISNARQWTEKSIELCSILKPPARTEECDMACAVATHNLGEFAEMEGMVAEARKRYEEARGLAKAIGFPEGVQNANEGLRRIEQNS